VVFPIVQLVVLGYAFGGNVKHLKVAVVDQDHGVPAVKIRELASAVSAGNQVFDILDYSDPGAALTDLRNGRVNGVLTIPPDYSRRTLSRNQPKVALIEDNTDSFVSATLAATMGQMVSASNQPGPSSVRLPGQPSLDVVEIYPFVPYVQYLLPGSITMSIFMMVMIGSGHLHRRQGPRPARRNLVTPITKFELIAGFNISGRRALMAGAIITIIGSLIADVPSLDPMRPAHHERRT
jgi:ABC-2 type transport system permease protein